MFMYMGLWGRGASWGSGNDGHRDDGGKCRIEWKWNETI